MEAKLKNILESLVLLIDDRFYALGKHRCRNYRQFNKQVLVHGEEDSQMAPIEITISYHNSIQKSFIPEKSETLFQIMRIKQLGRGVGVKINLRFLDNDEFNSWW